jgi:hypothetical protein
MEALTMGEKIHRSRQRRRQRDFGGRNGLPGTFAGPSRFTFSVQTLNLEQEGFARSADQSRSENRGAGFEDAARPGLEDR